MIDTRVMSTIGSNWDAAPALVHVVPLHGEQALTDPVVAVVASPLLPTAQHEDEAERRVGGRTEQTMPMENLSIFNSANLMQASIPCCSQTTRSKI